MYLIINTSYKDNMKNFLRKINNLLMKTKDNLRLQVLFCVTLSAIIIVCFLILYNIIIKNEVYKYTIIEDIKIINKIENIGTDSSNISLSGFAFLLEMDSFDSSISLFLRNINSGKEVWMDSKQSARPDVNSYFNCEYNFENSGFYADVKEDKLKIDECYEVLINLDYYDINYKKIRKTVSTNRYILNGELYDYNPYEFDLPDINIASNLLRKVFSDGKLCFYKKDEGMYVYQYEGKLYWVANKNFRFDESGLTYIPYHLYTSQITKLPTESIPHKYVNLDFYFEQQEYTEENTATYRVAVRDIPDDYAITYILTGVFDSVNKALLWDKSFHIDNIK